MQPAVHPLAVGSQVHCPQLPLRSGVPPPPSAVGCRSCKVSGWMGSQSLSRPTGATSDPVTKAVNSVHYVCLSGEPVDLLSLVKPCPP